AARWPRHRRTARPSTGCWRRASVCGRQESDTLRRGGGRRRGRTTAGTGCTQRQPEGLISEAGSQFMSANRASGWTAETQALFDKAVADKQVDEADILAMFDDPDADVAQRFIAQLHDMGVEIVPLDEDAEDDDALLLEDQDAEPDDDLDEDLDIGDEDEQAGPQAISLSDPELANDPVRMYLKEIGQVQLLDFDQESWLAAQMSAYNRVVEARRRLGEDQRTSHAVLAELYAELELAWRDVAALAAVFELDPPGLTGLIEEARRLRSSWWW